MSPLDVRASNPFWVLGLPVSATAVEVEREGQKLLAMLGVGMAKAATYATPFGDRPRDADAVRRAIDALRDPDARAMWEAFAALPSPTPAAPKPPAWHDALTVLGWR